MSNVVGIDPGFTGAIAILNTNTKNIIEILDMPTFQIDRGGKKKSELDLQTIVQTFNKIEKIEHVYIEQVHSFPKQGVSSAFAFGKQFGELLGILTALKIPYTPVHPTKWKANLEVKKGKDASRARASQLMPTAAHWWTRKRDEGRAEAALIAFYGYLSKSYKQRQQRASIKD